MSVQASGVDEDFSPRSRQSLIIELTRPRYFAPRTPAMPRQIATPGHFRHAAATNSEDGWHGQ